MKASVISLENRDGESKNERIKRVLKIISNNPGADLYLLPELWNTGFFSFENYKRHAEDFFGETLSALSDAAKDAGAYIFTGSFIEKRSSALYNTAVLLDRQGNAVTRYSKIHLFGKEREFLTCGDDICVCDTEFGKCGLSICYDLRFPELYRKMTDMGAEIFLNCSAWPKSRIGHWRILNRARAIENQAITVSVCVSGENNGETLSGESYAIMPDGNTALKTVNEFDTAELDTSSIKKYRKSFPVLNDRVIY